MPLLRPFASLGCIPSLALAGLLAACADSGPKQPSASLAKQGPPRLQDDTYEAVNYMWLAANAIPDDRAGWGATAELRDRSVERSRIVIEEAEAAGARGSADQRRIAGLYASFADEGLLEGLGANPLEPMLRSIDAMRSKAAIPSQIALFDQLDVPTPVQFFIGQDRRDPNRYVPIVVQGGLGLPDRDYYLRDDDARLVEVRTKYVAHVAKLLAMVGEPDAPGAARQVVDLETRLARAHWTRVDSRDAVKTYNRFAVGKLDGLTPGYAWKTWLARTRIAGHADAVVVMQPSYLKGFAETVDTMPLAAWKAYFKFHAVATAAPYLSREFVDERFAFAGTTLSGTPANLPRWKRGVALVEGSVGESLGRLYVAKYFPPDSKARMEALVKNLLAAYRQSIDGLDWMGPATKKEAQAKLARFDQKIGYPVKWRDYTALVVKRDDLLGNVWRARQFEYDRNLAKLGRPIDRTEWGLTPQTVNAYYSQTKNEIVFPAAILQPPFFDPHADDAVNYGAIGAVIGHEISHGFDDQGSHFDGDGRLRNWWTDEDRGRFDAKTRALVTQYGAFEALPGYKVDGRLTLGENIADNAGLTIAYKAYRLSLKGASPPVVDGTTGDQRFYRAYATIWRSKLREAFAIRLVKTDPHAPGPVRANGALRNQTRFYDAFDVKPGDRMFLAPGERVSIW